MFNSEYRFKFFINPLLRIISFAADSYLGVNELKRETPLIVSVYSKEDDFDKLEITIHSLLNQKIKPDRLILWISDEYDLSDLPYDITKFIKNGLEINLVKDLGAYTSRIYPLKNYPNAINVTADNCVYYPKNWLMKLYHSYIANPKDIHTHIAHKIEVDTENNSLAHYKSWKKSIRDEASQYNNFAGEAGGILYPQKCFLKEVFRDDIFLKNNITNPNIWFWFMGVLSGRKTRVVKNHINSISSTNFFKAIMSDDSKQYGDYDRQISLLMNYYRQNILPKITK